MDSYFSIDEYIQKLDFQRVESAKLGKFKDFEYFYERFVRKEIPDFELYGK